MLYLVATPIGNLSDFSLRAIETLKSSDYILCEDTRTSSILLRHYAISRPLKSYHKFNESSQNRQIVSDLQNGKQISLISDAGTPAISDPGADIVRLCIENNIPVIPIPGACALIAALISSGFPTAPFQFLGFLEKKENALKKQLHALLSYEGTTIVYESPHRLKETLGLIDQIEKNRTLAVVRELTKKFEEIVRGTAETLLAHWEGKEVKGEIVLLFGPGARLEHEWSAWSIEEHVLRVQKDYQISKMEAIKLVAKERELSKRELYTQLLPDRD